MINLLDNIQLIEDEHRNSKIILCKFPYNISVLNAFKKQFPSAKWSRTKQAWYLPDSTLYRKRLNMPQKDFLHNRGLELYEDNKIALHKFKNALTQKAFSENTKRVYLNEFYQLLKILKTKSVNSLSTDQLNSYFLYCIEKLKHSENQIYSRMNAIKCYFKLVLHNDVIFQNVIRPKAPNTLPKVLSKQEVSLLFKQTNNMKHLLLLKMAYGMGLRISELVKLKVEHINLDRMQVLIQNAKGKKDRYVNFPESLVGLYYDYLMSYQPETYLFEGQYRNQYTPRSVQATFKRCMQRAGLKQKIGIHGLRHSFATHLLEAGTDMVFIQKLLGHNQIKTTEIYAKVSTKIISKVKSPLDLL